MEKNLSYLLQLLEHTKEGDEESLQLLKLQDGFQYNPPAQFDPTKSKHQVKDDLCEMAYLVGAFNKLGLQIARRRPEQRSPTCCTSTTFYLTKDQRS